jgi:glutamate racemase
VAATIADYLRPVREQGIRALVLGCTHYPLLQEAIAEYLGPGVYLVDSGRETSSAAESLLKNAGNAALGLNAGRTDGSLACYVSDNPARFKRIGSRFLGHDIDSVEFVEPERYISSGVQ